jgi:SAM-dependent methyltransferase
MSYGSIEKAFYERYHGGNPLDPDHFDEAAVHRDYFSPGKRYSLVHEALQQTSSRELLLELGCSRGGTVRYLSKKYSFRKSVGIDIAYGDPLLLPGANSIEFRGANCNERLPFEDRSVDLLVAMMIIEHLFDPFRAFEEICRLLSDDGVAVVNLPLVTGPRNRLRLLFGAVPVTSVPFRQWLRDREWDGNHLHYFSVRSIRELCEACGLSVVQMSCVGRNHRIKNLSPALLGNELTFAVRRKDSAGGVRGLPKAGSGPG